MTAMIGYGVVVLLLAGGMILTAYRFDGIATSHVNRIRTEENQITYAERLRWTGEAIVATGRGYLISGDATFLGSLEHAQTNFDHGIDALTNEASEATTVVLVSAIEHDAKAFRDRQELLVASTETYDVPTLARRFEAELVPLQQNLSASLDRLINYKETAINHVYARVAYERARLLAWLHALLGVLVVASIAIAAYIARTLVRSYRQEQIALETSRKAVAARDEIMGLVAHDLRNPLSAILMRANLIHESAETATIQGHADGIETVVQRMEELIKTMLDVATIESGHFTVKPERCEAANLIDTTLEMFDGLASRKQIKLESQLVAANAVVHADRDRVLQVLQNLVGNALKFSPQGGRVTVAVERDRNNVRFRISDDGPGIPTENLSNVFDRYWKRETTGAKGTGLGLFIAKGIVEAHGGRIWAENVPGHGAAFSFTLSEAVAEPPSAQELPASERRLHAQRV